MKSSKTTRRKFRSVLCPIDFSPPSRRALRYAAAIAIHSESRLTVLFVQDALLIAAARSTYDARAFAAATDAALRRFVATSLPPSDVGRLSTAYRIAIGDPADAIAATAHQLGCDLIVMGTRGLSGVKKLVLGSTTRRVLGRASVPVFAVPKSDRATHSLKGRLPVLTKTRFVAPIDWDAGYATHVRAAFDVARRFNAELLLFHVVPQGTPPKWFRAHPETLDRIRARTASARLTSLASKFGTDTRTSCRVVVGDPAEQIAAVGARQGASLVIMTLRGGTGRWGAMPGTIAYRVLSYANIPILAFPVVRRS